MITVGTQAASSEAAIKLAYEYPDDIWATVGFHPTHLAESWHHDPHEQAYADQEKFDIEKLRKLAQDPKVVAIGECGLDYYRSLGNQNAKIKNQNLQLEVLIKQLELAQELNKALMIHCRPSKGTDDAYEDLLVLATSHQFPASRVVHFYVGSLAITKKLVDAGFYFTFGGVITFARDYDEVIKYIPLDSILLETDAPYVAPEPYRGKRNEPAFIVETTKKMAELKGISYDKVSQITDNNAKKIFKIKLGDTDFIR